MTALRACKGLIVLLFLGCDEAARGGDAGACVQADLVAQCPLASSPIVGAQAEASCGSAVGGLVADALGQATAQCYGVGGCRVMCQFQIPCRCGVASVRRDGVVCADCEGAAACGNGVCEGGEDPGSCTIDCGAVCNAGERRCDGEVLQACSLQGRFDTLPCPQGEVCQIIEELARCARDPDVIVGGDAGVGDGGPPVDDGRVIRGDGTWPDVPDLSTAPTPVAFSERVVEVSLETGRAPNGPTRFAQVMALLGHPRLPTWRLRPDGAVEGFGRGGTVRVGTDGALQTRDPAEFGPVDEARFCAAYATCVPDTPCPWANYAMTSPWRLGCMVQAAGDGACGPLLGFTPECDSGDLHLYPPDFIVDPLRLHLAGGRLVGIGEDAMRLVALDLETGAAHAQDPVGAFQVSFDLNTVALSADGRVAAYVGRQGQDEVVVVWSIDTDERRAILPRSGGTWGRLALNGDGQVLAVFDLEAGQAPDQGRVTLWNVAEERPIAHLRSPGEGRAIGLNVLAFSPNGRLLAADVGTEVEVWALGPVPEKLQTLGGDGAARVGWGVFSPDGTTLALDLGGLALWDATTGLRRQTLTGVEGTVLDARFTPDGQRLLVVYQWLEAAYRFRVLEP